MRKTPDQCFQSFSGGVGSVSEVTCCVGMISQRWSSNALFRRWMSGAVCNGESVLSIISQASSSHDREDGHMSTL
jgi:hypothetical protein